MKAITFITVFIALLVLIPPALGDEKYDELKAEYDKKVAEWYALLSEAADKDGAGGEAPAHPAEAFVPRFKAYAVEQAGKPEAIPALVWLVNAGARNILSEKGRAAGKRALEELAKSHSASPSIGDVLPDMVYSWGAMGVEPMKAFYRRIMEVNKDKAALSWAAFSLGFVTYHENIEEDGTAERDNEKLLKIFRRAAKEYEGTQAAKWASCFVFELERLQVGMKAPEIAGEDADGREIKLSQYLGRVVIVDFW